MFDKILEIRDTTVHRIKNIGLIKGLEIGSGLAVLAGAIILNFLVEDDLAANDILDDYNDMINAEGVVVEDVVDTDNDSE